MKKIVVYIIIYILIFLPNLVAAHSGRTDSSGGHFNRATGEYHFHNGGSSGSGGGGGEINTPKPTNTPVNTPINTLVPSALYQITEPLVSNDNYIDETNEEIYPSFNELPDNPYKTIIPATINKETATPTVTIIPSPKPSPTSTNITVSVTANNEPPEPNYFLIIVGSVLGLAILIQIIVSIARKIQRNNANKIIENNRQVKKEIVKISDEKIKRRKRNKKIRLIKTITIIALSILLGVSGISLISFDSFWNNEVRNRNELLSNAYDKISALKEEKEELKESTSYWSNNYNEMVSKLSKVKDELYEQTSELSRKDIDIVYMNDKLNWYDEYIVFIPPAGKKYHKKDCRYILNASGFLAFNIDNAKHQGYKACDVCH